MFAEQWYFTLNLDFFFFDIWCLFWCIAQCCLVVGARSITHHNKYQKKEVQIKSEISLFSKFFVGKLYCEKSSGQTQNQVIFYEEVLKFRCELSYSKDPAFKVKLTPRFNFHCWSHLLQLFSDNLMIWNKRIKVLY